MSEQPAAEWWLQILWYVMYWKPGMCTYLICSTFVFFVFFKYRLLNILCLLWSLIRTLLHQIPLSFNEGKCLDSGTNWSVSHAVVGATALPFVTQMRYAVGLQVYGLCLCCVVALPCLCCVVGKRGCFGNNSLHVPLTAVAGCSSDRVDYSHVTTTSQVSHLNWCTALKNIRLTK